MYISPLKALSYDIERNLRAPLRGIGASVSVGIRTGDTSQAERAAMTRKPPEILITTPESLYLILGSRARAMLGTVETVIVDEIHAVASVKRGAHLALTLERLEQQVRSAARPRRSRRAACGPLGDAEPARGGWSFSGGAHAQGADPRCRCTQAAGPAHPRAGRVDERLGRAGRPAE